MPQLHNARCVNERGAHKGPLKTYARVMHGKLHCVMHTVGTGRFSQNAKG